MWRTRLCRALGSDPAASAELRTLLADLDRAAAPGRASSGTVHNVVSGGVHNAPVIQSGRITGLTVHASHHEPPGTPAGATERDEECPD